MKQKLSTVTEGKTDVLVFKNKSSNKGPGVKKNLPFFNPSMKLNRDLSILVGQWLVNNSKYSIKMLDGLAASGIRGIRFANEINGDFEVYVNDWDDQSYQLIQKNIKKNGNIKLTGLNKNLNTLLSEEHFDYIDIDPFGSPVFFLDSAIRSIKNNGIIACTATDTATLCGVYPKVCIRRYSAVPFHSVVMKEIGLRILLKMICQEAGKYDKGMKPLFCYSTDHYFRVYVRINKGVNSANRSMGKIELIEKDTPLGIEKTNRDIGPFWIGKLQNIKIIKDLRSILFEKQIDEKNKAWRLLDLLEEEANAPCLFYTSNSLASLWKISPPNMNKIFKEIKEEGYEIYRTHFDPTGFKTDASLDFIEKVFKQK